jgi:hypothetical protein
MDDVISVTHRRECSDRDDTYAFDHAGTGRPQNRSQIVMLAMRASPGGPNPSTPESGGLFGLLSKQIREAAPLLAFSTVLLGAGMMVSWSLVACAYILWVDAG